ncbi:hypothetical protein BD779DRAFT_1735005 [Infundibulicybe gibba]|nr:hypothetical protein BD779DRAFT_1735005 [Infundibulicybe gibba]
MPGPGNKQKNPKKKTSIMSVLEPLALPPDDLESHPDLPELQALVSNLSPGLLRLLSRDAYEAGYNHGCKSSTSYKSGWDKGYEDGLLDAESRARRRKFSKEVQSEPQAEIEKTKCINTHTGTQTDAPTIIRTREASSQANAVTLSTASQASPTYLNATLQTTPDIRDAMIQTQAITLSLPQPAATLMYKPGLTKTGKTSSQTKPHLYEAALQTNEAPPTPPPHSCSAPPSSCTSRAENGEPAPKTPNTQPQTPPITCDTSSQPAAPARELEPPHMTPETCEAPQPMELGMNDMSTQTNVVPPSPPFDPDPKSHANWADDVELVSKIADTPRPPSRPARDLSALCPSSRETIWTPQRRRMRRQRPRTGRTRRGLTHPTPPALLEATDSALGPIFTRKHPTGIAYGKPVVITAFGAPTPLPLHLTPPPSALLPPHPAPPSPVLPLPHLASPPSVPLPPHLAPPSPASLPPPCPTPSHSSGLDWESDPRLVHLSNALRALGWIRPPNDLPRG